MITVSLSSLGVAQTAYINSLFEKGEKERLAKKIKKAEEKTSKLAKKASKLEKEASRVKSGGLSAILSTQELVSRVKSVLVEEPQELTPKTSQGYGGLSASLSTQDLVPKAEAALVEEPQEPAAKVKAKVVFTKAEVAEICNLAVKEAIEAAREVGVKLKKGDLQGYVSSHVVLEVVKQTTKTLIEEGSALEAELVAGGVAGIILEKAAADMGKDELLGACLIATARAVLKSNNAKSGGKQAVASAVVRVIAAGLIGREVQLPSAAEAAAAMVAEGQLSIDPVLAAAMKDLEEGLLQLSEDEEIRLRLKARVAGVEVVEAEEAEPTEEATEPTVEAADASGSPTLVPGSFKIL